MKIDPGTSSVVASSTCLVELLLTIFRAAFTVFSRFLVAAKEVFQYTSPRICCSFHNREEPLAYVEKRFYLLLALQKVIMVLKIL